MVRNSASRLRVLALAGFVVIASSIAALASGPVFWETSKPDEVAKGDTRGISINENGTMVLAPAFDLVYDTKETYIWSSAIDSSGNVYLGTGHEGRIFKVTPGGQGKLLYDSPELDVTALTLDAQGNLYAGTSPDGKIYKITPDGTSSVFYDPPDKYIWSLVFDDKSHTLYVGTGTKGIIYKVDPAGKASVLADTTETNIVSMALDKNGSVIAGTDSSGLILRVSPEGKVFALLDSPLQEIHRVVVAPDGSIYALGVNPQGGQSSKGNTGTSSTTSVSGEGVITISTSDDGDTSTSSQSQGTDLSSILNQGKGQGRSAEGARSALIKILPDGGNEVLWTSRELMGFAVKLMSDGRVLIGTGTKGRIYSVSPNRTTNLLLQSPEDQTSTLIGDGDNVYATSSNLGRLYKVGKQSVTEGTYTSPARDTKFVASWGMISWRGAGNVELKTRSGNTENPDATWSDWSPAYRSPGEQIQSPKARFIQWRATLRSSHAERRASADGEDQSGATARLQSVTVAYLPRNQAPEISAVSILPTGVALQEMPISVDPSVAASGLEPALFGVAVNVPPRRYFQKGARSLTWQGSDPNDDNLVYKIYYRAVAEKDWHLLADNLNENYYTIDGNRLPDGAYVFKVQASDSPSNPSSLALGAEYVTEVIEIDNTPPDIKPGRPVVNGHSVEAEFDATDSTSRILRGEYSVDGGAWQLVYPVDGIADSPHEDYKFTLTLNTAGEHVVAFRCSDSSSNVGTSMVSVTIH